jgi:hypothetical protein
MVFDDAFDITGHHYRPRRSTAFAGNKSACPATFFRKSSDPAPDSGLADAKLPDCITYTAFKGYATIGARYREGRRIASTAAEASVNNLVARRMVKKQQMRWSERGANLLLQVRVALANGDLAERLAYRPPIQPRQTIISPFVPVPLFRRAA